MTFIKYFRIFFVKMPYVSTENLKK